MMAVDRRKLKLFLSLHRYHRKVNNAYQRKVFLAIFAGFALGKVE